MSVGKTFITLADVQRKHIFAESLAATYDAARPAGMDPILVEQYEGNLEPLGPSSAKCTALGLTGDDPAASITGCCRGTTPTLPSTKRLRASGCLVAGSGVGA